MNGIIIKVLAGIYTVMVGEDSYECVARGKFKKKNIKPIPGDEVSIVKNNDRYVIEEVFKRTMKFRRPEIANVNQIVVVCSVEEPAINIMMLDKLLVLCEAHNLEIVLCINKMELNPERLKEINDMYAGTDYTILNTSVEQKIGIEALEDVLKNKKTVFAGPSGVGKSSLLNAIQPGLSLRIGEVSQKIKRGKHTTRCTSLIKLECGGYVADTPGFSALDITKVELQALPSMFPEFKKYSSECKFKNCSHINEPKCAVKKALENHKINASRYKSYTYFVEEIKEHRRYKSW